MRWRNAGLALAFVGISLSSSWARGEDLGPTDTPIQPPLLTLEDALRRAIQSSPGLQLAEEQVEMARIGHRKSFAILQPQVSLGGSYTLYDEASGIDFSSLYGGTGATAVLYAGLIARGQLTDLECATAAPLLLGDAGEGIETCADFLSSLLDLQEDFETDEILSGTAWLVPKHQIQFGLNINLPLTPRALALIQAASAQVDVATAQKRTARQDLLYGVYQAYLGAVKTQEFIDIQRSAAATAEAHLNTTRARFQLGQIPEPLVLRAEVELLQAQRDLANALRSRDEVLRGLTLAMGSDPGPVRVAPPPPLTLPSVSLDSLLAEALEQRPDLQAAVAGERAAQALRSDALAQLAPSLNLALQYGRSWAWAKEDGEWVDAAGGLTGRSDQWSFSVQASLPLWDGGTRIAQIQESASRIRQIRLQEEQLRQVIRKELTDASETLRTSDTTIATSHRQVDLAKENLRLTEARFQLGQDSQLSVLDARLALEQAQLGLLSEELNRDLARATLLKAAGRFDPLSAR